MSTVSVNIATSGNLDQEDRQTMDYIIGLENIRRAALPTPLPALLFDTAPNRKTSYELCGKTAATLWHTANIANYKATVSAKAPVRELKQLLPTLTDAKIAALLTLAKQP